MLVCADWAGEEDLAGAASRIALCANYQGGQSCISVQRVFIDRSLYPRFVDLLVGAVDELAVGDPWAAGTDVGPLIDETAAQRIESWVDEAVHGGARLLAGGTRSGTVVRPTVLADVPPRSPVVRDEVFGSVLAVEPVGGVDDGLRRINDSRFGLQAGIFTHDITVAFRPHRELEVGGIIVGDVPTFRAKQMPYGGVKESAIGREGVKSAMEDYTEPTAHGAHGGEPVTTYPDVPGLQPLTRMAPSAPFDAPVARVRVAIMEIAPGGPWSWSTTRTGRTRAISSSPSSSPPNSPRRNWWRSWSGTLLCRGHGRRR